MQNLKPRYFTPRNPSRKTDGNVIARVAEMIGTPLLPWQKAVVDVATEIDPVTGTYFYNNVVLTVQRQAGKSTLMKALQTRNALWGKDRRIYYLAQTGKDAIMSFGEYMDTIEKTKLRKLIKNYRRSNGSMALTFKNGSTIRPSASTDTAGHGFQGDLIIIDECWSLSHAQAKTIKDAFIPTMITRLKTKKVQPQIWWTSTEGTQASEFFNATLDQYRQGNIPDNTCFFDFGIPFDSDPNDLKNIWAYHPAAGQLFSQAQLQGFRTQFDDDIQGWARAFGNVRDGGIVARVIPIELWNSTATMPVDPNTATEIVFSVACGIDSEVTIIAACFTNPNTKQPTVQIVNSMTGINGVAERLLELQRKYEAPIIIDRHGPSALLHDMLSTATDNDYMPQYNLITASTQDALTAPQNFLTMLANRSVTHAADPTLDDAVAITARRNVGDSWTWKRRNNAGSTAPVEAVALALWAYQHKTEETPIQVF